MSRKRDKPNDPQTDEKTLEFQVNKQEEEMKKSIMKNESDVNNRKIVKVKKDEQEEIVYHKQGKVEQPQQKGEIKQEISEKAEAGHQKNKNNQKLKNSQQEGTEKQVWESTQQNRSNPKHLSYQPQNQGQQPKGQDEQKDSEKVAVKPKEQKKSLFSAQFISKMYQTKKDSSGLSLDKGVGIFGSNNSLKGHNLFNFSTAVHVSQPSLMPTPLNLFEYAKTEGSNAFGSFSQFFNQSIVSKQIKIPQKDQEQINITQKKQEKQQLHQKQQQQANSEEFIRQQQMASNPSQSTGNYSYTNQPIVFSSKLKKLKKPNGEIIENLDLLVVSSETSKIYWVVVRLEATKMPILSGFIVKDKTEVKHIGNKAENVAISLLITKSESNDNTTKSKGKKQKQMQVLKFQFETVQESERFMEKVKQILESL